LKYFTALSNIY